jgi:type IV pilus assembly protein PilM
MFNFFKNLFFKSGSNSVVGVDVGSSAIKVVQLTRKGGKAVLETYGELALGPYANMDVGRATKLPPEKIGEALRDILREAKVTTNVSAVSIPYSSSLISLVEMPAVSDKQLAQMIPLEARKYIPVPLSEATLDWWVIPKPKNPDFSEKEQKAKQGEKLDVLLVAIHNEAISKYQTIVKQATLDNGFYEIEIFSTIRSVLDQDTATYLILDLGAATTKAYIVERGIIRASHVINRGSQDITSALSGSLGISLEQAEIMRRDFTKIPDENMADAVSIMSLTLDYIFSEANRVLEAHERRYNQTVTKVILVGGGARLENVLSLAGAHFQTPIVLGDPFGKTEAPAFLEEILKKTGPEFATAVGLALRKLQDSQ